jgi:predicted phage gp36 major capsid-like protein
LSNNQIEDIRQNITNVVEERLINLNSAQILAFEELKKSHQTIDETLKTSLKDIEEVKKENNSNVDQKIKNITKLVNENIKEIEEKNKYIEIKIDGLKKDFSCT